MVDFHSQHGGHGQVKRTVKNSSSVTGFGQEFVEQRPLSLAQERQKATYVCAYLSGEVTVIFPSWASAASKHTATARANKSMVWGRGNSRNSSSQTRRCLSNVCDLSHPPTGIGCVCSRDGVNTEQRVARSCGGGTPLHAVPFLFRPKKKQKNSCSHTHVVTFFIPAYLYCCLYGLYYFKWVAEKERPIARPLDKGFRPHPRDT